METLWTVLTVIGAVLIYLVIGAFPAKLYSNKLEKLEKKLQRERPGENLEFDFWKELRWALLCFVAWWFVFPYEWRTHWRQWTYPYCVSGWFTENQYRQILQVDVTKYERRIKKLEDELEIEPMVLEGR